MISAKDFETALHLECLVPSSRTEWDIRTPDLNRPGMQFCGFYEFFAFERPQLIGKVEMAYLERNTGQIFQLSGSLHYYLPESDSPG